MFLEQFLVIWISLGVYFAQLARVPNTQTANGKMRACGDAGLQFRVSKVRV